MAIDKDTLAKNNFWIASGLIVVLTLGFWVALGGAREKAEKDQKDFNTQKKQLDAEKNSGQPIVNESTFVPPWEKRRDAYQSKKGKKWLTEWVRQYYHNGNYYPNDIGVEAILRTTKEKIDIKPPTPLPDLEEKDNTIFATWPEPNQRTEGSQRALELSPFGGPKLKELQREIFYLKQYPLLYLQQFPKKEDRKIQKTTVNSWEYPWLGRDEVGTLLNPLLTKNQKNQVYFPVAFYGGIQGLFRPVPWTDGQVTAEEAWLAQEDLWLRREVLWMVYRSYRSMAKMTPILNANGKNEWKAPDKFPKPKPGSPYPICRRFRNRKWEVTLIITEQKDGQVVIHPESTITNVSPTKKRQALFVNQTGLQFRIRQRTEENVKGNPKDPWGRPIKLVSYKGRRMQPINGKPLDWDQSAYLGEPTILSATGLDPKAPFELEEVFTYQSSPLKSIMAIEVASPSAQDHRTFAMQLQLGPASPKPKKAAPTEGEEDPYAEPQGQDSVQGQPSAEGAGPGAGTGVPQEPALTEPHKLVRLRYLVANEQARRIPVAFSVVVDEAFKEEILASAINSRLAMQITQVHWRHVHTPFPDRTTSNNNRQNGGGFPMGGGNQNNTEGDPYAVPPGQYGEDPMAGQPGEGGCPDPDDMFGRGGTDEKKPEEEAPKTTDENLIELTVYGIATVYDRFRKIEEKKDEEQLQPNDGY